MQPAPYKICPACQQAAALDAPQCLRCGRVYRTQFQALPDDRTQAFTGLPSIPHPGMRHRHRGFVAAITGAAVLVGLVGVMLWQMARPHYPFIGTWAEGTDLAMHFSADNTFVIEEMRYSGGFGGNGWEPLRSDHIDRTPGRWTADHGTILIESQEITQQHIGYSVSDDGKVLTLFGSPTFNRLLIRVADDYHPKGR